jgi:hypothetical protein
MASRYFSPAIDVQWPRRKGKRKLEKNSSRSSPDTGSTEQAEPLSTTDDDQSDGSEVSTLVKPSGFPAAPLPHAFGLPAAREATDGQTVPSRQRNLKQQHVAAINGVLHKCLQDGDYARASQAFGLLLRVKIHNRHLDLRQKGLWGIGAEILLNQHHKEAGVGEHPVTGFVDAFDEQGFEATKAFFERLILQYPHRKQRPNDVNELTFYPAMLGLWVFHIQARYRKHVVQAAVTSTGDVAQSEVQLPHGAHQAALQQLQDAKEVADRVESLIRFPPFDRHAPTMRLQADVSNWLKDLTARANGEGTIGDALGELAGES